MNPEKLDAVHIHTHTYVNFIENKMGLKALLIMSKNER